MSTLNLCNVNKIYPNNVQAVFDFNLDIKDKEFIVFVGPSGCGKSTTLRMVAGLEDITAGKLYIDGELMNNVEAAERGIAMVFQSYALYPHMTVFNNMAFCLKMRKFPKPIYDENGNTIPCVDTKLIKKLEKKIRLLTRENKKTHNDDVFQQIEDIKTQIENLKQNPSTIQTRMVHLSKSEINEKVVAAAKVLGLTEYLSRKPGALSGGQRQRVALGRAIVRAPKVFLMDEPLSNLDAKLRVQMRTELTRIHKEVGATTIYVTHDQTEAMTMADRIVVMKDGYIQQIDTPLELFTHPANLFVATFIGSPSMNILEGSLKGDKLALGKEFQLSFGKKSIPNINEFYKNQKEKLTNNINELNSELNELNENHKKSNAKAIEQRNSILEKDQNSLSACDSYLNGDEIKICFGIRPEHIYLENDSNNKKPSAPISLKIENIELLGSEYIVYSTLNNSTLSFKVSTDKCPKVGDNIKVCFDLSTIHVFDSSSSLRLPL